jgi:hypothetical protein
LAWKISDILYVWFVYEDNAINDIIVIIHTRSYLSTAMDTMIGLGKAQSITVGLYLIIKKCSVHIEVTSVCGQLRTIEAFKAM